VIPLAERIRCVETAWRVAGGAARPPERGEARDALAAGLADAARMLAWIEAQRAALAALALPTQEVSPREQARCVAAARLIVLRAAAPPARAVERDYLGRALEAAAETLRWAHAREYELRCMARPGGSAAARKSDGEARRETAPETAPETGPETGPETAPETVPETVPESGPARPPARVGPRFPIAMRAAMRCGEPAFQRWLGVEGAKAAAAELRARLGVASRKELDADAAARARWRALDARYAAWLACVEEEMAPGGGP
jgi:hypothetical protein